MEMQQVRYFAALCDTLNFTRAAEACNVSQPSLTRAIQQLEHELGGPLFNRERNNTHLTELGRLMQPHLKEMVAHAQTARSRARAFADLRTTVLKLGIARGYAIQPLDGVLARYLAAFPESELVLKDAPADELCRLLRAGELEVVLMPHDLPDVEDLHLYPLAMQGPQVVVPHGHPFAASNAVPLEELIAEPLVCLDACVFWEAAERRLVEIQQAARPRVLTGSLDWLLELVAGGFGVGIIASGRRLGGDLVGRPIAGLETVKELSLATRRGRLYSPPVKALIDLALRPSRARPASA